MKNGGFSLLELMITIVVIVVLAAIAIPSYQDYVRRSYLFEVIAVTAPYKAGVAECYQKTKTLSACKAGVKPIPEAITAPKGVVSSLSMNNGIIHAAPVAAHGIAVTDDYVLTPTPAANNTLTWKSSGAAVTKGYAD